MRQKESNEHDDIKASPLELKRTRTVFDSVMAGNFIHTHFPHMIQTEDGGASKEKSQFNKALWELIVLAGKAENGESFAGTGMRARLNLLDGLRESNGTAKEDIQIALRDEVLKQYRLQNFPPTLAYQPLSGAQARGHV